LKLNFAGYTFKNRSIFWTTFRGAGQQVGTSNLDRDINRTRKQVKEYDSQEKRLIRALRSGEFTQDFVLDELNHLKQDHEAD
jgi:hypothetical protein